MILNVDGTSLQVALFEPPHDKTNKVACAPSEDSDQPENPPSLIRVFPVRMKKPWVLSYPLSANEDSDQFGRSLRWAHMPLSWFCHEVAHFIITEKVSEYPIPSWTWATM